MLVPLDPIDSTRIVEGELKLLRRGARTVSSVPLRTASLLDESSDFRCDDGWTCFFWTPPAAGLGIMIRGDCAASPCTTADQ